MHDTALTRQLGRASNHTLLGNRGHRITHRRLKLVFTAIQMDLGTSRHTLPWADGRLSHKT